MMNKPDDTTPAGRLVPVAYGYWNPSLGWYGCSLQPGGVYTELDRRPLYDQAALDAAVAAERERCIAAVEAVPTHQWVAGSDQWGNPCPAKIVATRADYVAAIRRA